MKKPKPPPQPTARTLSASRGTYTLTGRPATLLYTPSAPRTLTATRGTYTLSGQAATLTKTAARTLLASRGTYTLTGQAVTLTVAGFTAATTIGDVGTYAIPALAAPAAGVPYRDPVFGTHITRVTDASNADWGQVPYSYWPPWSKDSTLLYLLVWPVGTIEGAGTKMVYDFNPTTGVFSNRRVIQSGGADLNPEGLIWSRLVNALAYGFNGLGLYSLVPGSTPTLVVDLTTRVQAVLPTATRFWQMSMGGSDRYFAWSVRDATDDIGMAVYDKTTDTLVVRSSAGISGYDEVHLTRDGALLVISANPGPAILWDWQAGGGAATIAEVQRVTSVIRADSVDSATMPFPSNVGAGHLIAVWGSVWQSTPATSVAVSDTRGTSYTVIFGATGAGSNNRAFLAYGITPSGGSCTITVDPNGTGNYLNATAVEFSGVNTSTPLSVNGGETIPTPTTTPSAALTTLTDGELVLRVLVPNSATTITPGEGTQVDEDETGARSPYNAGYAVTGAAGSYTANWTLGSAVPCTMLLASFKAAGSGYHDTSFGIIVAHHDFGPATQMFTSEVPVTSGYYAVWDLASMNAGTEDPAASSTFCVNVKHGTATIDWPAIHTSWQNLTDAVDPSLVYLETYLSTDQSGAWRPFFSELWRVWTDGSSGGGTYGKYRRLCHHRSKPETATSFYSSTPRGAVDPSGRWYAFVSDWQNAVTIGAGPYTRTDVFILKIPTEAEFAAGHYL